MEIHNSATISTSQGDHDSPKTASPHSQHQPTFTQHTHDEGRSDGESTHHSPSRVQSNLFRRSPSHRTRTPSASAQKRTAVADLSHSVPPQVLKGRTQSEEGPKRLKGFIRLPLTFVLTLQCLFVVAGFVALILTTSLMMDSATKDLVTQAVSGDLKYARSRLLAPIFTYERMLVEFRTRYMTHKALTGADMCSDGGLALSGSAPFYTAGISAVDNNPLLSFVFHLRWSETFTRPDTGLPDLVECDVTPGYLMYVHNGSNRLSTVGVTVGDLERNGTSFDYDAVPAESVPIDFYNEPYVPVTMGFTALAWDPMVLYVTETQQAALYLALYAPMLVNRTNSVTGLPETFSPDMSQHTRLKKDPSLATISTLGMSMDMAGFTEVMAAITPASRMAHTSLYDMNTRTLLCTSANGVVLYDVAANAQWGAGRSPSSALNEAFARAHDGVAAAQAAYESDDVSRYATVESDPGAVPVIRFEHDTVTSAIGIATSSGINFVIVQSTPREHYFGPVTRLRTIMIIVGVVAAVAVVAVCVVIGLAIRIPLREVETNMQLAAVMKNDDVVPTTSVLAEVSALCTAFDRMNAKLLAARAFMPQAMLCEDTDDSMGDEGDINEEDEYAAHKPARLGADNTSSVVYTSNKVSESENTTDISTVIKVGHHNASTSDFHRGASTINKSNKHAERRNGLAATASGATAVVAKRVTILTVNARGFHDRLGFSAPSSVSAPAAELTAMVSSVCAAERGVIDSFHGDHFVLSFNAAKSNAQGPQKAMRAAAEIAQQGRGMSVPTVFSMGASTGRACVGQLGTAGLMRLSIVGPVYSRAVGLERVCRMVCERTSACASASSIAGDAAVHCVLDRYVASEVSHSHALQLLGWLSGRPFCDQSINKAPIDGATVSSLSVLYALRHGHPPSAGHAAVTMMTSKGSRGPAHFAEEADEWLYELQQVSATDPLLAEVNAVMLAYVEEVVAFVGTQPQTNTAQTHNALSSADQSLRGALELIQSKHEGLKVSGTHNLLSNAITPKNTNSFLKESSTQSIEESTLDGSITQSNAAWKPASNTNTGAANVQDHPHTSVHQNQRNDMRGWGRVAFLYATNVANGLRAEYTV